MASEANETLSAPAVIDTGAGAPSRKWPNLPIDPLACIALPSTTAATSNDSG